MIIKKLIKTVPAASALAVIGVAGIQAPAAQASSEWDQLAQCESGGNWNIDTGNGYYGGLQFSQQSWEAVGGSGNPAHAPKSEQIQRAEQLQNIQGWGAWPSCSSQLGLQGSPSSSSSGASSTESTQQEYSAPTEQHYSNNDTSTSYQAAPEATGVSEAYSAPYHGEVYTVQPGDTLNNIAVRFNVSGGYHTLQAWNDEIVDPNFIYVGQQIIVG